MAGTVAEEVVDKLLQGGGLPLVGGVAAVEEVGQTAVGGLHEGEGVAHQGDNLGR